MLPLLETEEETVISPDPLPVEVAIGAEAAGSPEGARVTRSDAAREDDRPSPRGPGRRLQAGAEAFAEYRDPEGVASIGREDTRPPPATELRDASSSHPPGDGTDPDPLAASVWQ